MTEITQTVNNSNKDAILDRYTVLGWGFHRLIGQGDKLTELHLIWPHERPPEYPDVSDLL